MTPYTRPTVNKIEKLLHIIIQLKKHINQLAFPGSFTHVIIFTLNEHTS